MARVLILTNQYPDDLASGRFLRVFHLCRELARQHECYFADTQGDTVVSRVCEMLGVTDAVSAPALPTSGRAPRRHLRISNARYLQLAYPGYVRETVAMLRERIRRWRIEVLVVMAEEVAELAFPLELPTIIDNADCAILTIQRARASRGAGLPLGQRARLWLRQLRQGGRERALVNACDLMTTIAEPDRQTLLAASRVAEDRIVVVPNGVADAALRAGERVCQPERSIVFWGNLDFPPNWTAVRFFFENVFVPYLAGSGVTWHIYGRGADAHLSDVMAHPGVRAGGYRERLFDDIVGRGVMINPMVEGSGLKNKVLEAFACRIPVVTTRLGVEALPVAHRRECLIADDPAGLAASVVELLEQPDAREPLVTAARRLVDEHYTWPKVGEQFGALVGSHAAATGSSSRPASSARRAV